jgi:protocatechuate 3,4-dioxygenase beta subunit
MLAPRFLPVVAALASLVEARPWPAEQSAPLVETARALVRGRIVDTEGRPVADARVAAHIANDFTTGKGDVATSTSDRTGAFEIAVRYAGPTWVTAEHRDFAPAPGVQATVDRARGASDLRIVMHRGGRIVGSVRSRDGRPLPGAAVDFRPSFPPFGDRSPAMVQADGTFELRHVPGGEGTLIAVFDLAGPRQRITGEALEIREGETTTAELVMPEVEISGRVTRSGAPGSGLRVSVVNRDVSRIRSIAEGAHGFPQSVPSRNATTTTDQDGSFTLMANGPGAAFVQIGTLDGAMHFPSQDIEIPDSDTHFIELAVGGTAVSGIVTDQATHAPLAQASVCALARRSDTGRAKKQTKGVGCASTDEEGRFLLEIAQGEYDLRASHFERGYPGRDTPISVPESGLDDLQLSIEKAPSITVRALDAGGRPVADALVTACDGQGKRVFHGGGVRGPMTDADGRFVFLQLEHQPYSVFVLSLRGGILGFRPDVQPGPDEAVVTLRPGSKVVVRAVGPDGGSLASAEVSVRAIDGHPVAVIHRGLTDAQGVAVLSMPAGTIDVAVTWRGLEGRGVAAVPAGGEGDVTVSLAPTTAKTR